MATLPEEDVFPEGIYRIETTDPVVGGPPNEATGAGITNIPAMQLAKRTRWLKNRVDALLTSVVAASTAVAGIVRLNSATNSTSTTDAATPAAVKEVMDAVVTKAPVATTVTGAGLATGGGNLAANRTIDVPVATQAEAEAGTDNTKAMTPLTVAQAMAARSPGSLAPVGWQKLPSGLIIQWGVVSDISLSQVYHAVTFPVAFPTGILSAQVSAAMTGAIGDNLVPTIRKGTLTTTGMTIFGDHATVAGYGDLYWFAFGF